MFYDSHKILHAWQKSTDDTSDTDYTDTVHCNYLDLWPTSNTFSENCQNHNLTTTQPNLTKGWVRHDDYHFTPPPTHHQELYFY